jgi:hypothetical protein
MLVSGGGPAGAPPAGACAITDADKVSSAYAAAILDVFMVVPSGLVVWVASCIII